MSAPTTVGHSDSGTSANRCSATPFSAAASAHVIYRMAPAGGTISSKANCREVRAGLHEFKHDGRAVVQPGDGLGASH
ncbi:hypothetical protein [Paractinoplanes hotanensis]|uniref:Uncharacterized protein n=1 Tax=Paractinoplanes hotanensis TaxID=2906497 RepID=A0ABT0Y6J8_9ACTN|nr:hypothetical protein [Actinoplanes hotanensis]MCM4081168.1 hypothetical protein [Actinoplanes hotanensis]